MARLFLGSVVVTLFIVALVLADWLVRHIAQVMP